MPNNVMLPSVVGKPPPGRDAKGRARSRDYLKQCLQEVNYLTSPQALNPLPNRPLLSSAAMAGVQQQQSQPLQAAPTAIGPQQSQQQPSLQQQQPSGYSLSLPNLPAFDNQGQQQPGHNQNAATNTSNLFNGRPRKIVPEIGKDYPAVNGLGPGPPLPLGTAQMAQQTLNQPGGISTSPPNGPPPHPGMPSHDTETNHLPSGSESPPRTTSSVTRGESAAEADLGLERLASLRPEDANGKPESEGDVSQITAIFRPDAAGEWKERLRAAHEAVERAKGQCQLAIVATKECAKLAILQLKKTCKG